MEKKESKRRRRGEETEKVTRRDFELTVDLIRYCFKVFAIDGHAIR